MKLKMHLIIFIILSMSVYYNVYAQTDKKVNERLNQKIEELEKIVQQLESRISVLENKLGSNVNQEKSSYVSKGDYKKKENWRALQLGMSKDQVKELLGEPESISKSNYGSEMEFWSYPYPYGSVTFGDRGTLKSWSER